MGAGDSGNGGGVGATTIQILGLDRVAGATSATREAARLAAEAAREYETGEKDVERHGATARREGGVEPGAAATLLIVEEEVSTRPEDISSGDGLAQVAVTRMRTGD